MMTLKLLCHQGYSLFESFQMMPLLSLKKDKQIYHVMTESIQEGKTHDEVIKPLKAKLDDFLFVVLTFSHTLIQPIKFYDAMIHTLDDMEKLHEQAQKAKRYPMLVFILTVMVFMTYIYVILPAYQEMFFSFGLNASKVTQMMIDTSHRLDIIFSVVVVFTVLIVMIKNVIKNVKKRLVILPINTPKKYFFYYQLLLKMSIFSEQYIPYYDMFQTLYVHEQNRIFKKILNRMIEDIEQGMSMKDIWKHIPHCPSDIQTILPLTDANTRIDALKHLSDHYKRRYQETMQTYQSFIEPVLLLILGVVILGIGYLMYMPLFELYNSIGQFV